MKTWYAKALSDMTKVSVRTLHHYDKIGLLKPSHRQPNGYRVYSEADLSKLQRIIALKFFGFELVQIKALLESDIDMVHHLKLQSDYLQQEARALNVASEVLNRVVSESRSDESISWQKTIELIEVYQMTKNIEHEWVRNVLDQNELAQYVAFEEGLAERFTDEEHTQFKNNWAMLVGEMQQSIGEDPASPKAQALAERCMTMVDELYGREYAGLRSALWNKGMKQGKDEGEHGLSAELAAWLDKAMEVYWLQQVFAILDQAGPDASSQLRDDWQDLLDEMFGNYETGRDEFMSQLLADKRLSKVQRDWLLI